MDWPGGRVVARLRAETDTAALLICELGDFPAVLKDMERA